MGAHINAAQPDGLSITLQLVNEVTVYEVPLTQIIKWRKAKEIELPPYQHFEPVDAAQPPTKKEKKEVDYSFTLYK